MPKDGVCVCGHLTGGYGLPRKPEKGVKVCVRCEKPGPHRPRSDNPSKLRTLCVKCEAEQSRQWRKRKWRRRKAHDTWRGMIARCHDPRQGEGCPPGVPRYRDYGAKGVSVCLRWRDPDTGFDTFLSDVGFPPTKTSTLDRKINSRNYSCGKCLGCVVEALGHMTRNKRSNNFIDMTDERVGMLRVLEYAGTKGAQNGTRHNHTSLWLCRCDCGNEVVVSRHVLRMAQREESKTRSCGCMQGRGVRPLRKPETLLPIDVAGERAVFKTYRGQAKKRGLSWALSRGEFLRLISGRCYYCGQPPNNEQRVKRKASGVFRYSGIDRRNNDEGYAVGNCVSCCTTCNHAKHKMSEEEFVAWIRRANSNLSTPGNARWVDPETQQANRKNSVYVVAVRPGDEMPRRLNLAQWGRLMGLRAGTISKRLKRGWEPARAVVEAVPEVKKAVVEAEDLGLDDECPF